MKKQRKLTDDQLEKVMAARHNIKQMCSWDDTDRGRKYWHGVAKQLLAMALHATTDGQPWVEPAPPIPDDYRLAVEGDEGRRDCKIWCLDKLAWTLRGNCVLDAFASSRTYIVPVDRTPTDEDAKSRPEVAVRDVSGPWQKVVLYGVLTDNAYSFLVVSQGTSGRFKHCRHLYPGE